MLVFSSYQPVIPFKTTILHKSTDLVGAVPQNSSGDFPSIIRPSLFQRLRIRPTLPLKRSKTKAILPAEAAADPPSGSPQGGEGCIAGLDVSAPAESLNTMIPSSLTVTPPAPPSKRQRSRDSRMAAGQPASTSHEVGDGPPPSPGLRMPAFLNQTKADVAKLFQELEWRQRFRLQHAMNHPQSSPFRVERSPMVFSRNRYGNVQPWDQSRIRLKHPIDGSDYVNASPISLTSRSAPLNPNALPTAPADEQSTPTEIDLSRSKYIATQGPKEGQFSHFWNMVMQETVGEVGVIVMLTQCWEGSKEKCGQYFPTSTDVPTLDLELGERDDHPSSVNEDPDSDRRSQEPHDEVNRQGSVTLVELYHDAQSRSEVRKLRLQIGVETKTIWHYLFNGWPDYTKPEGEDRRALVELIKQSAAKAGDPSLNPRFVHCSAGVGRTGTFIALDHLLRELAHGKLDLIPSTSRPSSSGQRTQSSEEGSDTESMTGSVVLGKESTPEAKEDPIFETVNTLREQRMMMVMNDVQFSFLYEVLREAYVEMYSPLSVRVVGSGAGELKDVHDEVDEGAVNADMGEPSPKMARTGNMLYVGPSEAAHEEKKELERKASNANGVAANSMVAEGAQSDPYAAVDPEVVRMEKGAKRE